MPILGDVIDQFLLKKLYTAGVRDGNGTGEPIDITAEKGCQSGCPTMKKRDAKGRTIPFASRVCSILVAIIGVRTGGFGVLIGVVVLEKA
jgi:hypothetical protein